MIRLEWHEFGLIDRGCVLLRMMKQIPRETLDSVPPELALRALCGELKVTCYSRRHYAVINPVEKGVEIAQSHETLMEHRDELCIALAKARHARQSEVRGLRLAGFNMFEQPIEAENLIGTGTLTLSGLGYGFWKHR